MANKLKIGFIGLGAMGLGMASCLLKAGFQVTGFDISETAMARFVREGGTPADTPRAAASKADVLVVVVATSDQTSSVLFDGGSAAVPDLPRNTSILLCITASPGYVTGLGSRIKASGRSDVRLIDCPISGGESRAWEGTLSLLCAGQEADIMSISDVLGCLGSKIHSIPGGIGAGSGVKVVHQILVGVHILACVEVMGLAYIAGLDLHSTYDRVMHEDGATWLFGQRAAHILDEKKVPASSLTIILKDLAMIHTLASNHRISLPLASLAYRLFDETSLEKWDTDNDCNVINAYLLEKDSLHTLRRGSNMSTRPTKLDEAAITNLLVGIHAAAAFETLNFARRLGLDTGIVSDVVKNSAGSSVMFDKLYTQAQDKKEMSLKCLGNYKTILEDLEVAIEAASPVKYPLSLSSAALQQFYDS